MLRAKLDANTIGIFVILIFYLGTVSGQDEKFSNLILRKEFALSDQWEMEVSGEWKHFYDENGWSRLEADLRAIRKFNSWSVHTGFVTNNTYDTSIINFWELRPWAGLGLTNVVFGNLSFEQLFRFEWRNLLFTQNTPNKITTRTRYRVRPTYLFPNKTGTDQLRARISYEWFFVPNKDLNTRFISSREFSAGVFKDFVGNYRLGLIYTKERFNTAFSPNAPDGHTLGFLFSF